MTISKDGFFFWKSSFHFLFQKFIFKQKRYNLSNRAIAHRLGKAPQTINNEIKRELVHLKRKIKYSTKVAQEDYEELRAHSKRSLKLTPWLDTLISQGVKKVFIGSHSSRNQKCW